MAVGPIIPVRTPHSRPVVPGRQELIDRVLAHVGEDGQVPTIENARRFLGDTTRADAWVASTFPGWSGFLKEVSRVWKTGRRVSKPVDGYSQLGSPQRVIPTPQSTEFYARLERIRKMGIAIESPVDQLFLASIWKTTPPSILPTWSEWVNHLRLENSRFVIGLSTLMNMGGHPTEMGHYVRITYSTEKRGETTVLVGLRISHSEQLEDLMAVDLVEGEGHAWFKQRDSYHHGLLGAVGEGQKELSAIEHVFLPTKKTVMWSQDERRWGKDRTRFREFVTARENKNKQEDLIRHVQVLAQRLGRIPTMVDMDVEPDMPTAKTFLPHFRKWNEVLRAAGLPEREKGSRVKPGTRSRGGIFLAPDAKGMAERAERLRPKPEGFAPLNNEVCKTEPLFTPADLKKVDPIITVSVTLKNDRPGFAPTPLTPQDLAIPPTTERYSGSVNLPEFIGSDILLPEPSLRMVLAGDAVLIGGVALGGAAMAFGPELLMVAGAEASPVWIPACAW